MGILKDDDEFMGHERTDGVEMVFKDYNDKKTQKNNNENEEKILSFNNKRNPDLTSSKTKRNILPETRLDVGLAPLALFCFSKMVDESKTF